jgi:hypothetical protein
MPKYNGFAFLGFIERTEFALIPRIIISAQRWPDLGAQNDPDRIFTKPLNLEELLNAIKMKIGAAKERRKR